MLLTRRSKLKDAWRHPEARDLLLNLMRQYGKSEQWITSSVVANMPLQNLDRMAPGFCDVLLKVVSAPAEPEPDTDARREAWWKEAVVYQIYLPSFMDSDHDGLGDLAGVARRLSYLSRLGVDTLMLWPPADERGWRDYPAQSYRDTGETEPLSNDFRALAEQAHAYGMRVVVTIDITSTAEGHPWFGQAPDGVHEKLYILRPGTADVPPNNWTRAGVGGAWKWYPKLAAWGLRLHGRGRVDLDWDNPEVRSRMARILNHWRERGADGFFVGPIGMISKSGYENGSSVSAGVAGNWGFEKYAWGPYMHRYLRELRRALPPDTFLLGDATGAGGQIGKLLCGERCSELDMVFDVDYLIPNRDARGREAEEQISLGALKRHYLAWMDTCGEDGWRPLMLETPNTPRIVSRLGFSPLYRVQLAKLLATLMLTLRGTPFIYQGEELGIANTRFASADELRDETTLRLFTELSERFDEATAFRRVLPTAADHARAPMPWSPGANAGFSGAPPWIRLPDGAEFINASFQVEDKNSVWQHYHRLIALRREWACLVRGSFNPVFAKNKKIFCYFRMCEGQKLYVELNLTDREVPRPGRLVRTQKLLLSNYDRPERTLRPLEANIYTCE